MEIILNYIIGTSPVYSNPGGFDFYIYFATIIGLILFLSLADMAEFSLLDKRYLG